MARELICRLRPHIADSVTLDWQDPEFPDQRLQNAAVGVMDALSLPVELQLLTAPGADIDVSMEAVALGEQIWRLSLAAGPAGDQPVPHVQVFSYLELPGHRAANAGNVAGNNSQGVPAGDALEYLDVHLLDARQHGSKGNRADVMLKVLVYNRADWPIEYSMSISGGHYENCRPSDALYRHDRYAVMAGQAQPGQRRVEQVLLSGLRHKPAPIWGIQRCAGIGDIESLEDFHAQGYRIIDYVRWSL